MICENCSDEFAKSDDDLVAAGGWCTPLDDVFAWPDPVMCSDCRSRLLFCSEFGFDPGRNGENLRVPRGGIKFPTPKGEK